MIKQTAGVNWIGYNERADLHAIYIKVLPAPEITRFQQGVTCEGISPKNAKWQGCIIEKISDNGYHIKFRKSGEKEVKVFLYRLLACIT